MVVVATRKPPLPEMPDKMIDNHPKDKAAEKEAEVTAARSGEKVPGELP